MPRKSDRYRAQAVLCEQRAKETTDRGVRQQWEELAIQWHSMANQAVRLEDDAAPEDET